MKISIIGTGYVGLVTAAIFADLGNKVWGIDVDKLKIKNLQLKIIPFYEPGLKEIVSRNVDKGRLHFTDSYSESIPQSDIIFICVGTPPKPNGDYDLSFVFSAAKTIAKNLNKYTVVCIKSTVPPSTTESVKEIIKKETKVDFDIASCPEFLREGSALKDRMNPSRIVIGAETKRAINLLLDLHKPIKAPRLICDIKSAQLIKYAANAFLATKISYINSIARICDSIGADIDLVSQGLGMDPRIGGQFLKAGLGYGGSCFPKDTWALISYAKRLGYDFRFLKEVDNVNQSQIDYFLNKIIISCNGSVKDKIITILGLAFKPDTDDIREARSVLIIQKLLKSGAKINAYDPVANEITKKIFKDVNFFDNSYDALKNSSALVLVTEWMEFKKLDFFRIAKEMKEKNIIHGRTFLALEELKKIGYKYQGIGKKA